MNKALLVSALASHAIKNYISPKEEPEMAALSKEGVKGIAESLGWSLDEIELGDMADFAEIARADLVAENERLKATPPDQRQDLHCVVSDIAAECRELRDQLTATRTALAAAEARIKELTGE